MSNDAAIFENETELDIFPPKWDGEGVSYVLDIDI